MANNLHLHVMDHMNDCIRGVLSAVTDDLYNRAKAIKEGKLTDSGAIEALEFAGQEIENLSNQFK